jgi:hypothetical protein
MTLILIEAHSTAAAVQVVAEAQTGTLWSVALGTTTRLVNEGSLVIVECTEHRAGRLVENCPEAMDAPLFNSAPVTFANAQQDCQVWYMRGKLGE